MFVLSECLWREGHKGSSVQRGSAARRTADPQPLNPQASRDTEDMCWEQRGRERGDRKDRVGRQEGEERERERRIRGERNSRETQGRQEGS